MESFNLADTLEEDYRESIEKDNESWAEPQPLQSHTAAAPYPIEALPERIRQAVEEVQDFVKAPMALVASTALASLSTAGQAHIDIERAKKLSGPTSLFLLSIAESGERKSTCDSFFSAPIREYEKEQAERVKPLIKKFNAEKSIWDIKRSALLESIKKTVKNGGSTVDIEEDLLNLEQDEPRAPLYPKLLLLDETPESLGSKLATRYPVAGILSSEAGLILGSHGMNKETVMRNLTLLNTLWDGVVFEAGRKVAESIRVEGARLTLGLQAQESVLRVFFDRAEGLARGSGFLARFLISWPESTMGTRFFTEAPDNWPALTIFNNRISDLLNMPLPIDEEDQILCPPIICLSNDAKAAWTRFHDTIESGLPFELGDVKDVASKSADNSARLAGLFHVFLHGPQGVVSLENYESAAQIISWHLNESLRFFAEIGLSVEDINTTRLDAFLLDYCRKNNTDKVPTSQPLQYGPVGLRKKSALEKAVGKLEGLERTKMIKDGKRKIIAVNPALLEEVSK
ncbi:MAG: DUF3987 domain-containing protein [Desulfobacteraceae bacterium]|nr:DUF3987 domain-containing protein [Desulfobacteraceae bacterium]MBU4002832.1 DUF3987 domain-containing protein [Pseudomonadota bacterium]